MEQTGLSMAERARYLRQMLLPDFGADGQMRLRSARVLIVGAGGLGSPAALYLAAAGIGKLTLMDFDRVETSNLHRQILFRVADVGRSKAEAAADHLRALNPHIDVEALVRPFDPETAMEAVSGQDIVIDGTDNFTARYLVNDACFRAGVPYVFSSIFRHEGLISLLGADGGPCYRCVYPEPPPPGLAPSCAEGGVLGVLPGIMGTLQATEVIKYLLGEGRSLRGRMLRYDAFAMRVDEFAINRDPDCALCGSHATLHRQPLGQLEQHCASAASPVARISAPDLLRLLSDPAPDRSAPPLLLDVRDEDEHSAEAIAGSICIPLGQIGRAIETLPRDRDIICYCRSGARSLRAAEMLAAAGFSHVRSLDGGILMWDARALAQAMS